MTITPNSAEFLSKDPKKVDPFAECLSKLHIRLKSKGGKAASVVALQSIIPKDLIAQVYEDTPLSISSQKVPETFMHLQGSIWDAMKDESVTLAISNIKLSWDTAAVDGDTMAQMIIPPKWNETIVGTFIVKTVDEKLFNSLYMQYMPNFSPSKFPTKKVKSLAEEIACRRPNNRASLDVILEARERIKKGWIQRDWGNEQRGAYCLGGALLISDASSEAKFSALVTVAETIDKNRQQRFYFGSQTIIIMWNDGHGRKKSEVLALLDSVIENYRIAA